MTESKRDVRLQETIRKISNIDPRNLEVLSPSRTAALTTVLQAHLESEPRDPIDMIAELFLQQAQN